MPQIALVNSALQTDLFTLLASHHLMYIKRILKGKDCVHLCGYNFLLVPNCLMLFNSTHLLIQVSEGQPEEYCCSLHFIAF